MSGYFYIEYADGRCTQIEFKTAAAAKKAYKLYSKEPEDTADGWGWEDTTEGTSLAAEIRAKRAVAQNSI